MKLILTFLFLAIAFPLPKIFSQIITLPNEFTGPAVITDIEDFVDPDTSTTLAIDLRNHFQVTNVLGQVVQFNSNLGIINLELFDANTPYNRPVTVANFLNLVTAGDYNNTIIHRSPPNFVIQSGGFINTQGTGEFLLDTFREIDPISNEPGISNTVGTIAMAKQGGNPDSATSQWFISVGDNSANLDEQNGGFTVFGRIIGNSITVVNAIANLIDFPFASPFDELPLTGFSVEDFNNGVALSAEFFVTFTTVSSINIYPTVENSTAVLSFQLTNNNQNLLTVSIVGSELRLDFISGQTGQAEISVATFDTHNLSAETSFLVTVTDSGQNDVFDGTDIPDFPGWKSVVY